MVPPDEGVEETDKHVLANALLEAAVSRERAEGIIPDLFLELAGPFANELEVLFSGKLIHAKQDFPDPWTEALIL